MPRVGVGLSGTLTVHASDTPEYQAPAVTGFDSRSGLVRLGATTAQLGYGLADPFGPLFLSLGWHERDARPSVTGVVEQVIEETGRFLPMGEDRTLLVDPGSRRFQLVDEATRWPEEQLERSGPATLGVVVALRVTELRVPSDLEIDQRLAEEERERRTVHLTGPLAVFGSTVPSVGSTIEVDLGDERLEKDGVLADLTRMVSGEVLQASAMSSMGPGGELFGVMYIRPDPENPPAELMVRLLIDQLCGPPSRTGLRPHWAAHILLRAVQTATGSGSALRVRARGTTQHIAAAATQRMPAV